MDTAEEMGRRQRAISVSEFFEKNRHLLGYDNKAKAMLMIVKEGVDNSLDACEEAGILPEIYVKIKEAGPDKHQIVVRDNGPGIVREQIPKIFGRLLYGSKFHRLHQSRGQQGLGISCAVLYSQLTTGLPVSIASSTGNGKTHKYQLKIDVAKNRPLVVETNVEEGEAWHGVEIRFVAECTYRENRQSVMEYIKQTAISNPYADIVFDSPYGKMEFKRGVDRLPTEPREIMPHLYGVELGVLGRMLASTKARTVMSFLTSEFSRLGKRSASEILLKAGITKTGEGGKPVPYTKLKPRRVTDEQAMGIIEAVKQVKLVRPPTDCLSPLGTELIRSGLVKELNPEFVAAVSRSPEVYRGWPFQVECVTGDTKIILENGGIVNIKDYVENGMNEKVYSMDDSLKIAPKKVTGVQKIAKRHEIYLLKTRTGREIKITGNNQIPIIRNGRVEWMRIDEVSPNEYVAVPREIKVKGTEPFILDLLKKSTVRVQNQDLVISIGQFLKKKFGMHKEVARKLGINYDHYRGLFKKSDRRPSLEELEKTVKLTGVDWENTKRKITAISVVNNNFRNTVPVSIPLKCNEDLLYILGLINSDGCMLRRQWGIFFVNKEDSLHKLFGKKINSLFGLHVKRKGKESMIYNKTLYLILEKIQTLLPTLSNRLIKAWLKGYADGDGMISRRKNGKLHSMGFATAVKEKAKLVQYLLSRINIISKIVEQKPQKTFGFINGRKVQTKKNKYNVLINDRKNVENFYNSISFRQPKRKKKLLAYINEEIDYSSKIDVIPLGGSLQSARIESGLTQFDFPFSSNSIRTIEKNRQNMTRDHLNLIAPRFVDGKSGAKIKTISDSDIHCDKIVSIKKIDTKDEYVYDLTVETGNFIANNILIHNCGLAFGGSIQSFSLLRFANRVPLLYQQGICAMTRAVQETDWRRYGLQANKGIDEPLAIFIHLCSVWVPFTSESKEAIANYDIITKEIKLALQECARQLSIWLSGKRKKAMLTKKKSTFERYAGETAQALGNMTDVSAESIQNKILNLIKNKWGEIHGDEIEGEDQESGEGDNQAA